MAVETVYANERSILAAYVDISVVGDDDPVPPLEREFVRVIA